MNERKQIVTYENAIGGYSCESCGDLLFLRKEMLDDTFDSGDQPEILFRCKGCARRHAILREQERRLVESPDESLPAVILVACVGSVFLTLIYLYFAHKF